MKFFGVTLTVFLTTVLVTVGAQSPLLEAEKAYPTCALKCMATYIPQSSCAVTDVPCICKDVPLNANISACAVASCTIKELLTTQNASHTLCGAPVRDRTKHVSYSGVIGGSLALIAFILRITSRFVKGDHAFGIDDVMLCVLIILAVPPTVFAVILAEAGLGKDLWTIPFKDITRLLFYYFMGESFYLAAMVVNKICLLLLFLRIFEERNFRIHVYIVMGLSIGYGVAFIIVTIFQCQPISYSWNSWDGEHKGRCNNINLQGWLSAVFNIVLDLIIIGLPLPKLARLNMGWKRKMVIMIMFSLGVFVTIVSVVRLHSFVQFAKSQNVTWDYVPAAYWSTIELHVGIICVCLPAIRSLFIAMFPQVMSSIGSQSTEDSNKGSKRLSVSVKEQYKVTVQHTSGSDRSIFIPLTDIEVGKGGFDSPYSLPASKESQEHLHGI